MSIYLDEFETLYGISDNIEKLRSKILELAFRGELTKEINTHEFNAEKKLQDLLKKRKTMIKNKEIRKPRKPRGKDFEKPPFPIPKQWLWVKLIDSIGTMTGPKKLKKKDIYDNGEIPVVSQSQELIVGYTNDEEAKVNKKGPLIIFGDHTTNIKFIDFNFAVGSDGVKILKPIIMIEKLFYYYLKFINIKQDGYKRHFSKLKTKLVPLIPLEEQKIIVEQIKKLMNEVDKLETKLKEKEKISQTLSGSITEAIKNSQDAEELKGNLKFIIDNFDVLFKDSVSMDEMRNIVLQLAIEGKLVIQHESDDPASGLVDEIKIKRKKLVKKGESRNINKKINEINKDELPFDIPDNWAWVRLGNLTKQITDGTHQTPNYIEEGIPFLSVKNISQGYLDKNNTKYISREEHLELINRCKPEKGDILFCRIGTLGKALKLRDNFEFSIFVSLGLLKLVDNSLGDYLEKFLNSPEFYRQIEIVKVGGSHTNKINLRDVPNFLIPLPPLKEQKRITKKVDSIMSIIEKLEEKLLNKENLLEKLGSI